MQIAGSTRSFWDLGFAAACSQLQDLGFDKVELWITDQFEHLKSSEIVDNIDAVVAAFRDASRLSPVALFLDEHLTPDVFQQIVQFGKALRVGQITIPASPIGTPFNSEIDRLREQNHMCIEEGIRLSILTRTGLLTEDPHTATELCQSVKGLGITLDPTYYVFTPRGEINFDVVFPHVSHAQLRDTSTKEIQVPGGLGDIDYNRITAALKNEGFDRTLTVDLLPQTMSGEERLLELRKLRRLLETLL